MSAASLSLVFHTVPAQAQSLADVAKKEADRRGAVQSSGKVYTNVTLTEDFTRPAPPPAAPTAAPKPEAAPAPKSTAGGPTDEPVQVPIAQEGTEVERQAPSDKGEDYWRSKATALRTAIATHRAQIAAFESRLMDLAEGKTGTDRRERDLVSQALLKAKADVVSIEEDQTRFEATAKAYKVPSEWIR